MIHKSCKKIIVIICISTMLMFYKNLSASVAKNSWPIITRSTRSILPPDLQKEAEDTKMSVLKPTEKQLLVLYKNYPNGSILFANNNDLATKFNTLIQTIQSNPEVIEFIRKIQILSLNQLYAYIMKIYTNFNLITPGLGQEKDNTTQNIMSYLSSEAQYAMNKKKLLMNHFLNLIQAQFSGSIISYLPKIPADLAVAFGQMFIENDKGIDLKEFTKEQKDPTIIAQQEIALKCLQQYIDFYQTYTRLLAKIDKTGTNQYYEIAQGIQKYLTTAQTTPSSLASTQNDSLNEQNNNNPMNPAMFFYDIESMRSILFIPFVASTLPKNSMLIPWAPVIVDAAIKNTQMNGHQVAYFKDATGKKIQTQAQAQSLFLLTEVGSNLFEEELLAQPGWLNNQGGCIRILSACLGDSSALVGMGILDETIEKILQKATKKPINNTQISRPQQQPTVEKNKSPQMKK